jgi:glycosyltransferase involved in cell wall biosynthesis
MVQAQRKIHVVFDMTFPLRLKTGTRVYADQLLSALAESDSYRVTCVAERQPVRRSGFWRIWNGIRNLLWIQLVLPIKLLILRADLLHAPSYFAPVLCPCPLVLTVFDVLYLTQPLQDSSKLFGLYARFSTRAAIRRAKMICTVSNVSRDEIVSLYGVSADRVRVTYPGVGPLYRPQSDARIEHFRKKYGLPRPYFLFVGEWAPRKNLPRLIEAFGILLKEKVIEHELILIGPKRTGAFDVDQILQDLEIARRVRCLGFVDDEDMASAYSAADAFVFPSLGEGFGIPLIEAMACGTPVVASNVSCIPEVAGDAAVFFNPEDAADIARAMKLVLQPDLRATLKDKGLERAKHFTWQNTAAETEAAYRDALR